MTRSKILIVEDESIVALNLSQRLRKLGYDVAGVAASGAQALSEIEANLPDLVLMDIHIQGDLDGIETARRIPAELQLPVVYLTAYSEDSTLERARSTRPYGYLTKPFSERELHATIQMALERNLYDSAIELNERRLRRIGNDLREELQAHCRIEADLRTRGALLEAAFEAAPIPVIALDFRLNILRWNPATVSRLGYGDGDLVGANVSILFPSASAAASTEALRRMLDGTDSASKRLVFLRADHSAVAAEVLSARALLDDGHPAALVLILRLAAGGDPHHDHS